MASYTTPALVRSVVKTRPEIDTGDPAIQVFCDIAHDLVTRLCLSSGYLGAGAPGTTLELIERLLGAHYYAVRDRTLQRTTQGAGDVSDTFTLGLDKGLAATQYGREAMFLDTAGNLAAADRLARSATPQPGVLFVGRDHGHGCDGPIVAGW